MKKYIKPVIEIVETHAEEMICLSGGGSKEHVAAEAPYAIFDEDEDVNLW